MDTGILRDFVIVITGCLFLFSIIIAGILAFLLYRQIRSLTKSVKDTMTTAKEVNSEVKDTVKSAKTIFSMFKGQKSPEPPSHPAGTRS
jgi:phosphate/sulfate permease